MFNFSGLPLSCCIRLELSEYVPCVFCEAFLGAQNTPTQLLMVFYLCSLPGKKQIRILLTRSQSRTKERGAFGLVAQNLKISTVLSLTCYNFM